MNRIKCYISIIVTSIFILNFGQIASAQSTNYITADQSKTVLNKLVTLPSDAYDKREAKKIITRISKLPNNYLTDLVKKNVEIRLINNPLTDEPEYAYLKGVTPRGWEGTGKTWDDVPGAGGVSPTLIRIGYSEYGKGHGTLNLELHEIAHTIDYIVFNDISDSNRFRRIWKKETRNLIKDHPNSSNMDYFTSYPEEYFAETFTYYYLNNNRKIELKKKAPLTYQFFQQLNYYYFDRIAPKMLTVNKVTDKTTFVTGKTEAQATIQIKLGENIVGKAVADSNGNYKVKIKAQKKLKKLTVTASDKAGNEKQVSVTVK